MGDNSKIQWTSASWNPFQGCRKISQGCARCYMFRDKERYGQDPTNVHRSSRLTFEKPLKWQREAERGDRTGDACRVFTCSWSDWFIEEADAWRDDAWAIIRACPLLTFQVLTKRSDRIAGHLPTDWGAGWPNVWLGVSVEDRENLGRIDDLRIIPAAIRFLSVEPLLGDVGEIDLSGIAWVIVGGESGNETGKYEARPCDIEWIRSIVRQCLDTGVACFVKQLGSKPYVVRDLRSQGQPAGMPDNIFRVLLDLRDRHGEDWSEWPEDLRVRNFPIVEAPTHA